MSVKIHSTNTSKYKTNGVTIFDDTCWCGLEDQDSNMLDPEDCEGSGFANSFFFFFVTRGRRYTASGTDSSSVSLQ